MMHALTGCLHEVFVSIEGDERNWQLSEIELEGAGDYVDVCVAGEVNRLT